MRILHIFLLCFCIVTFSACSASQAIRAGRIIATGDVQGASAWAAQKGTQYALNPRQLERDLKIFAQKLKAFRKAVSGKWGKEDVKETGPKTYVKYTQNYLSRAAVDFDKGIITVETLDSKQPNKSLHNAIVTTLLTPYDPRGLDIWSAGEVRLEGVPFLLGEVHDQDGKDIRWPWRAERYANLFIRRYKKMRLTSVNGKRKTVHYVSIPMVKDHMMVRALKYKPYVDKFSRKYRVSPNLVYAIIKTESDFNPWAVSHVPAYGLMQIVPKTAGADIYRFLHGKKSIPSSTFLYKPENNIQYGSAYLHILDTRYLAAITNPISREYCVIAAYNGGAGNVLRTFDADRTKAALRINSLSPHDVYNRLYTRLPYMETRRYLWKVVNARKDFVHYQ